jgi:hypothetical protein
MKRIITIVLLLLTFGVKAQVNVAEYFFDTDPGPGNGYSIAVASFNNDSAEITGNITLPIGFAPGAHTLHIRFGKTIGSNINWGLADQQKFYVYSNGASIISMEYFFDTDPGVGNGTALSITALTDTATYTASISTAGLIPGLHKVYVRAKDINNSWSLTEVQPFYLFTSGGNMITNAEYFFDTDPGVGNGLPLVLNSNVDTASFTGNIITTGLVAGPHVVSIRMQDANGLWSTYETIAFNINKTPITAEYFFDTDPGLGNGYTLALTSTISGEAEFTGTIPIPNTVGTGAHKFYIRSLDNSGQWGLTDSSSFNILCDKWFRDLDGDTYGNINDTLRQCVQPIGYVNNGLDCNDSDPLQKPGQVWFTDTDGDDYSNGNSVTQCTRPTNGFLANELIATTGDCNDNNAAINPAAAEVCDLIDNDCDGLIDENVKTTYYADADGDGFGNPSATILACSVPVGYVSNNTDCNDNNVNINAPISYYIDADLDGIGGNNTALVCSATAPIGYSTTTGDCNDNNNTIYPNAPELCDGLDNNCNGLVDMADPAVVNLPIWYADADGDGYGNYAITTQNCTMPSGYVANNSDCDDADALEFPNQTWYLDFDQDGYGTGSAAIGCGRPPNHKLASELIAITGDCNDNNASIKPNSQYFVYSNVVPYTNSLINNTLGSSYNTFQFEVIYVDSTNALPLATYPRVALDYEGNNNFTNNNDRNIIMTEADITDLNTNDGKKYIASINALPNGTNYQTRIYNSTLGCATTIGPFNYPDVVVFPDIQIFANDITFSQANPSTSSPLTIQAVVRNESDYPAQNFIVHLTNQWDTTIAYTDITINSLAPHSSTTVTWNITTPAVPAWCPMQVKIDYTNVITETNELDNSAVRPFINGAYNLPGSILVTSNVSPKVSTTINNFYCSLYGTAHYTGTAVPLLDSSVAGATVSATILETGATFTGYTNSAGNYNIGFPKPLLPGTYNIKVHITDYTLDGYDTTDFVVVYVPNPCPVDLSSSISFSRNTTYTGFSNNVIYVGESINGTIAITNNGCGNVATNTYSAVSQTGGSFTINGFNTPALAANSTYTIGFSNLVFNTAGTYVINVNADNNGVVVENNENNNGSSITIQVINNVPDIVPLNSGSSVTYYCTLNNNVNNVTTSIANTGGGATGSFIVKTLISFNNVLIDSAMSSVANILPYSYSSISFPYTFNNIGNYSFQFIADELNTVVEASETNNIASGSASFIPCVADLAIGGCNNINVYAQDANYYYVQAGLINTGNLNINTTIPIRFTYNAGVFDTIVAPLAAGASTTVYGRIPIAFGSSLEVVLDYGNTIPESVESNNAQTTLLCSDLTPTVMCYGPNFWNASAIKNGAIPLYVAVNHIGPLPATNVEVNFSVQGPGIVGSLNLGNALLTNTYQNCICPFTATLNSNFVFPDSGTYVFTITVDPNNAIAECSDANNTMVVSMYSSSKADMRVLSQFINPSLLNPAVGQPVTFDITYENIGAPNVNDSMELFLQVNNTPHDSVKPVGGLITGDNNTVHFSTVWSSNLPGVHVVRAIIDHDNEIAESNENNNEATRAIIVGSLPNLYFQTITASNLVPSIGNAIVVNGRVGNDGDSYIEGDIQLSYVNNNLDTIVFGTQHVAIPANDSVTFNLAWTVLDDKTTIIGKLINSTSLEATYVDNNTALSIGAMIINTTSIPACNSSANGIAVATAIGGDPPYTYQWNNGLFNDSLMAGAGMYTISVTDNGGVTKTAIVTIANNNPPTVTLNATPSSILVGSSAILSANGASTYTWINASTLNTNIGAIVTATPSATTIYTVVSASIYGCTNTATIQLQVNTLVSISSNSVTPTNCSSTTDGVINIMAANGVLPYTYSILPATGLQSSAGVFTNLAMGSYTVKVTDALGYTSTNIVIVTTSNSGSTVNTFSITATGCYTLPWGTVITTSGTYTNSYSIANACDSIVSIIATINSGVSLSAKVILSGPYNTITGLMQDSLRIKGLVPLSDPYLMPPYAYVGSPFTHVANTSVQTTTNSILSATGSNAIVDWVLLQLRSKSNPSTIIKTKAALLKANGTIVEAADSNSNIWFADVPADSYYVSIKHRNHLGVQTLWALPLYACTNTLVDFTSTSLPLLIKSGKAGNPAPLSGATRIQNGLRTLYAGNCEISSAALASYITYNTASTSDRNALFVFTGATGSINGYTVFDVDLNGSARFNGLNNDRLVISINCANSNIVIINQQTSN